jgi:hypothetical protein
MEKHNKQSSHFLVAFLILTTISSITCVDVLPSLFGRTTSGTIPITSFFDPISQISAIASRFIFFRFAFLISFCLMKSNASGGKAIVTLSNLDPSFLIGIGSFVIGNSSNPIELQTSVDLKVLSNGLFLQIKINSNKVFEVSSQQMARSQHKITL